MESMKEMLKLNLQMFADETPEDDSDNTGTGEKSENGSENKVEFTDEQQEYINRLIAQNKSKAKAEAEKAFEKVKEKAIQDALDKEKSYAEMSEEERRQSEFADEKAAFEKQKAEFEFNQLLVDVKDDLIQRELPSVFAPYLAVAGNKDASIERVKSFESEYKKAVSEAVKKELQHPNSLSGNGGGSPSSSNYGEKVASRTGARAKTRPFNN